MSETFDDCCCCFWCVSLFDYSEEQHDQKSGTNVKKSGTNDQKSGTNVCIDREKD